MRVERQGEADGDGMTWRCAEGVEEAAVEREHGGRVEAAGSKRLKGRGLEVI